MILILVLSCENQGSTIQKNQNKNQPCQKTAQR